MPIDVNQHPMFFVLHSARLISNQHFLEFLK